VSTDTLPLHHPLRVALALAIGFGAWEIVFASFMADDLMQLCILEGRSPAAAWTGWLELYTLYGDPAHVLAMKDAGLFPWFFEPSFEMAFLRPFSSALLWLDHAAFGLHPAGYRLHGVLWSIGLVAAVGSVLRRALPGRNGTIALLIFVLSGIQAFFCWTAARHVVIAAALGFTGLAAHLQWREHAWRPGAVLSVLALALALAASEAGVAVAAYVLAYELIGASDRVRDRLGAVAPSLVVLGVYLLVWHGLGHGASSGTGYIDPVHDPARFLFELPGRLAVLLGGVVLGGSADLWVLRPDLRPALSAVGGGVSFAFAGLLALAWPDRPATERRALRWLAVGALASALPFAGTPIGSRCLLVPFVGGSALVGVILERWWTVWRQRHGVGYRVRGAGCVSLAVIHLGLAPLGRLALPAFLQRGMAERAAAAVREAELNPSALSGQTVIVLVAPDLVVGLHGAFYRLLYRLPMPAAWHVLSWAPGTHRFVRTGPDTLEMEVERGGISSPSLGVGTVIALREMEATVLAVGNLGPSQVRFRFTQPLDDPSLTLLTWEDGRLRRVEPPPIGATLVLPSRP
jgi:hypothetical protein